MLSWQSKNIKQFNQGAACCTGFPQFKKGKQLAQTLSANVL
jgi:hypothetical protein